MENLSSLIRKFIKLPGLPQIETQKEQLDHILINMKWRGSLQDFRIYRGTDILTMVLDQQNQTKFKENKKGPGKGKDY